MQIKFHPIKSTGKERKTPLFATSYADLEKLQGNYGFKGRYFIDNVEVQQQTILDNVTADKIERKKLAIAEAQAAYQKKFDALKARVDCLSPDEQKFYWMLYGNLEAIYIPAQYSEEDDEVELSFKGIPLAKITCRK